MQTVQQPTAHKQELVACSLPLGKRVLLQRGWRMSEFGAVLIREKTTGPPRESKIVKSVVSTIRRTVSTEGPTLAHSIALKWKSGIACMELQS